MCPIPEQNPNQRKVETVFISAVILRAADPGRLAAFYRDVLGIALEVTHHGGEGPVHFECELGDVHFAIYPFPENQVRGPNAVTFALAVPSLGPVLQKLQGAGISPLYDPVDRGFANMTAFNDPEGNLVELTELSSWWLGRLSERPKHLRDVAEAHGGLATE
jgi:predicted enzyme related to lactoylglutathione lyase